MARIDANFLKLIVDINALSLVSQVLLKARCLKFASTFILYLKQQCSASQKSTGSDWKYIFICIYAAKLLYLCLKSLSTLKPWVPYLLTDVSSSAKVLCIDGGLDGEKSKQGSDDFAVDGDIEDYLGSKHFWTVLPLSARMDLCLIKCSWRNA